jgi:hypothetical protein
VEPRNSQALRRLDDGASLFERVDMAENQNKESCGSLGFIFFPFPS